MQKKLTLSISRHKGQRKKISNDPATTNTNYLRQKEAEYQAPSKEFPLKFHSKNSNNLLAKNCNLSPNRTNNLLKTKESDKSYV